jgi:hypothetical protein
MELLELTIKEVEQKLLKGDVKVMGWVAMGMLSFKIHPAKYYHLYKPRPLRFSTPSRGRVSKY